MNPGPKAAAALALCALLAPSVQADEATRPDWLTVVGTTFYDCKTDDLVTAGLGAAALSATSMPCLNPVREAR